MFKLFLLSLLFIARAYCELPTVGCEPITANTGEYVARLEKEQSKLRTFQADFVQSSYMAGFDLAEDSRGKISYMAPDKLRWEYIDPEPQQFLLLGDIMKFYQPVENQLLIEKIGDRFNAKLPSMFLSGLATVSQAFGLQSLCRNDSMFRFSFYPKSGVNEDGYAISLRSFVLEVRKDDYMPSASEVIDLSDNKTAYRFSSITLNAPISSEIFSISPPAGTDIIDNL